MNNCPDNHDDGDYGYAKGNWSGRDHRPLLSKLIEPFWHIPKSILSREGIAEKSVTGDARRQDPLHEGGAFFAISCNSSAGHAQPAPPFAQRPGGGRPLSLQEQPEVLELDV